MYVYIQGPLAHHAVLSSPLVADFRHTNGSRSLSITLANWIQNSWRLRAKFAACMHRYMHTCIHTCIHTTDVWNQLHTSRITLAWVMVTCHNTTFVTTCHSKTQHT